jgi:RecA/RadA recombinase
MARRAGKKAAKDRLDAVGKVAGRLTTWRPATEVLTRVEAQPTIFVQLDEATRVGGWPIQRFGLIHGPSNGGKTALCVGLGKSFLQAGGFFAFIDAEMTTPADWLQKLMGEYASSPGFVAARPRNYEAAVDGVREFAETIANARAAGELPEESTGLIVVDSIRKLVPERLLAKIMKHGAEGDKGSIDGAGGRAGQMRAAINAQWLDELVPLLYHTRCAMIFVRSMRNGSMSWCRCFTTPGAR